MTGPVDDVGTHARLTPERIAARDLASGRSWTYRDFDDAVARFAAALAARGVGTGDRFACLARNRVELILLHLACARLGSIYVPLNWRLARNELVALIADCEPSLLLGDASLAAAGLSGSDLAAFIDEAAAATPLPWRAIDRTLPSLILYTSGTSGRPKGVLHSEASIAETAINFGVLGRVGADAVVLGDAPMFHVVGLITNVRPALLAGGCVVVSDGFVAARTLARLADPALGITHYFCVPQMAGLLRADPTFDPAPLRRLTAISTGGAPHPAAAIRLWLADGIAIADGYGLSEAGTVLGMPLDLLLIDAHAGSAGVATARIETRIVDVAGAVVAPGKSGELELRGANLAAGYWRRPAETAAAFTADGWFRTGDIARADERGFHWIIDRRKDMFISGGENVYPAEIEAVLAGCPGIVECAVVGVPDARWGEVGHLAVVGPADPGELQALIRQRLAAYKCPAHVTMLAALPRNGAGKVLKAELKKLLLAGGL